MSRWMLLTLDSIYHTNIHQNSGHLCICGPHRCIWLSDFLPDMLFLTPLIPLFRLTNSTILFFSFLSQFLPQRSFFSLSSCIPTCYKVEGERQAKPWINRGVLFKCRFVCSLVLWNWPDMFQSSHLDSGMKWSLHLSASGPPVDTISVGYIRILLGCCLGCRAGTTSANYGWSGRWSHQLDISYKTDLFTWNGKKEHNIERNNKRDKEHNNLNLHRFLHHILINDGHPVCCWPCTFSLFKICHLVLIPLWP